MKLASVQLLSEHLMNEHGEAMVSGEREFATIEEYEVMY